LATTARKALRAAVEALRFDPIDAALRVPTSIGLCEQADAPSHERLLAAADRNLYRARNAGRNRLESWRAAVAREPRGGLAATALRYDAAPDRGPPHRAVP